MTREQFLTDSLKSYLRDSRVVPRSLKTPEAQGDEMKALLRILLARAPRDDFEEWWDEVKMFIGSHAETRAWPTEKEMLAATSAARVPGKAAGPREEFKLDPVAVAATNIREGKAVGDGWLWGRLCVDLLKSGLVREHDLTRYRDAFTREAEAVYGKPEAARMVDEMRARHRDALAVDRGDVAYFSDGGDGAIRPRRMQEAVRGPSDDGAWRKPQIPLTPEEAASRPYTDAERARIRTHLRPQPPEAAAQ